MPSLRLFQSRLIDALETSLCIPSDVDCGIVLGEPVAFMEGRQARPLEWSVHFWICTSDAGPAAASGANTV